MASRDFGLISTSKSQAVLTAESLISSNQSKEKNQEIGFFLMGNVLFKS